MTTAPRLLLILLMVTSCGKEPSPDEVGDDTFIRLAIPIEKALVDQKLDSDGLLNGGAKYRDIKQVDSLILDGFDAEKPVSRLEGLNFFTNLTYLRCRTLRNAIYDAFGQTDLNYQAPIDTLDISQNLNLIYLDCSGYLTGGGYSPTIRYLKMGNNSRLKTLIYRIHMQQTIDLSKLDSLEEVDVFSGSPIPSLSVCQNPNLRVCLSHARVVYVPSLARVGDERNWSTGVTYLPCK